MDEKKSVLFYTDWAKPLQNLPLEDVGRLFFAILDYTKTGKEPSFENPAASTAWDFMRLRLDDNLERWEGIREKRRVAGRMGADATNSRRQQPTKAANADFAENKTANPAVTATATVPVTVTVKTSSSSGSDPPEKAKPSPESFWTACGYTGGAAVHQTFAEYRKADIEDALILEVIRETAAHAAKCPLAYTRRILDRCQAQGIHTLDAWQAAHRGGGAKRVDRAQPSGNDFLADATERPRRHKRKE